MHTPSHFPLNRRRLLTAQVGLLPAQFRLLTRQACHLRAHLRVMHFLPCLGQPATRLRSRLALRLGAFTSAQRQLCLLAGQALAAGKAAFDRDAGGRGARAGADAGRALDRLGA